AGVVRRANQAATNRRQRQALDIQFAIEVQFGRKSGFDVMNVRQVLRAAQFVATLADENDKVAFALETHADALIDVLEYSDHADEGRGMNYAFGRFVVERHVTRNDRQAECAARFDDAFNRLHELPEAIRLVGVAEAQAIGDAGRLGADANQVTRAFGDGEHRALLRVEVAVTRVAIR